MKKLFMKRQARVAFHTLHFPHSCLCRKCTIHHSQYRLPYTFKSTLFLLTAHKEPHVPCFCDNTSSTQCQGALCVSLQLTETLHSPPWLWFSAALQVIWVSLFVLESNSVPQAWLTTNWSQTRPSRAFPCIALHWKRSLLWVWSNVFFFLFRFTLYVIFCYSSHPGGFRGV